MYKIIFTGGLEDVYVETAKGMELSQDFKNGTMPDRIEINGMIVSSKSIKAIVPGIINPDAPKGGFEYIADEKAEFTKWRQKRLALSPKDRAKDVSMFNFLSQALRGRNLTDEEVPKVQEAQEKWFENHLDWHNANPVCYFKKKELPIYKANKGDKMTHMKDYMAQNALELVERHLMLS